MIRKELSESDFENLKISECDKTIVADFFQLINRGTLGTKISIALNQKQQGHFDKAMLNISEANRDQVIAIREIQFILDKLAGRSKTEVIFEKYRQIFPFQIGLTNGEEVLNLLSRIQSVFDGRFSSTVGELHNNEKQISSLVENFCTEMDILNPKLFSQKGLAWIVLVDDCDFCVKDLDNFLWVCFLRSNPSKDTYGIQASCEAKHWGCNESLVTDARRKPHHSTPMEEDPEVERQAAEKWNKLIAIGKTMNYKTPPTYDWRTGAVRLPT